MCSIFHQPSIQTHRSNAPFYLSVLEKTHKPTQSRDYFQKKKTETGLPTRQNWEMQKAKGSWSNVFFGNLMKSGNLHYYSTFPTNYYNQMYVQGCSEGLNLDML